MGLPAALESGERGDSPSPSPSSGGRCKLRLELVLALACFSLVTSLAALAMTVVKRREPLPMLPSPEAQNSPQKYAQLVLKLNGSSKLTNERKLDWYDSPLVQGVYLDSAFEYSSQMLTVKHSGRYCIFAQLTVRRVEMHPNKQVKASLVIHHTNTTSSLPVLTIPLDLSANSNSPVEKFSAVSSQLAINDKLHVTLMVSENSNHEWVLHERGNFFGLFEIKKA